MTSPMLVSRFYVRQKITIMVNRHQISSAPTPTNFRVAASMAVALDALQSR
jgi:hypothetical protein